MIREDFVRIVLVGQIMTDPKYAADAFTKAWEPAEKPLMTVILTFEDNGGAFWGPR